MREGDNLFWGFQIKGGGGRQIFGIMGEPKFALQNFLGDGNLRSIFQKYTSVLTCTKLGTYSFFNYEFVV